MQGGDADDSALMLIAQVVAWARRYVIVPRICWPWILLTLGLVVASCGGGSSFSTHSPPATTEPERVSLNDFRDALDAGADCAELFALRDQLPNDTQKGHADVDLERISCSDPQAARVNPGMSDVERGRENFESAMRNSLASLGYNYPPEASLTSFYTAGRSICDGLAEGLEPSLILDAARAGFSDDPELADATYSAARRYICPNS